MITEEEKEKTIEKATKLYDLRIKAVYNKMNQELKNKGLQGLENPFEPNMKGEI